MQADRRGPQRRIFFDPKFCWVLAVAMLLATGRMPERAAGQELRRIDKLSSEITGARGPLAPEQKRQVEDYARYWVSRLTAAESDTHEVAEARERLIEPLKLLAGEHFKPVYWAALGPILPRAMESERPIVRLNAMIVAAQVPHAAVVEMVERALKDPCAAVRYWAGKVVTNLGMSEQLETPTQQRLVAALKPAIIQEENADVVRSLLVGLSTLDAQVAGAPLLEVLNERLKRYAQNEQLSPRAEFSALEVLFRHAIQRGEIQGNPMLKGALGAAYRYMMVSARALANLANSSSGPIEDHRHNVEAAETWLVYFYGKLAEGSTPPVSVKEALADPQKWGELPGRVAVWEKVLRAWPFNLSEELGVP